MHRLLSVATFLLAVAIGFGSSSDAAAQNRYGYPPPPTIQDRFCLQGAIWGYPGNCLFSNYQQCMASASGTDAYCGENPAYLFEQRRPARRGW